MTSFFEHGEGYCSNKGCFIQGKHLCSTVTLVLCVGNDESRSDPYCSTCIHAIPHTMVLMETKKPGRTPPGRRIRKISQKQERRNMEAIGGRMSKASGAMASDKSDGRLLDRVRLEAKFTFARSYRLTRDVLNKIRGECMGKEEPAVQIDFNDKASGRVEDSWVVIPLHVWERYVNATTDDS